MISRSIARTLALSVLAASAACSSGSQEELGRRAAEEAKAAIQSIDAAAHQQKVDPEVVKRVQQQLTTLKEYMGPVNGKLDSVTLNAFEAFQRSQGMTPDGILSEGALSKLSEVASQPPSAS